MSRKPSPNLEPATTIIGKFGGAIALADLLGINVSSVHRWTYSKGDGGTDGAIPTRHQRTLLALARKKKIKLTPAHFFESEAA